MPSSFDDSSPTRTAFFTSSPAMGRSSARSGQWQSPRSSCPADLVERAPLPSSQRIRRRSNPAAPNSQRIRRRSIPAPPNSLRIRWPAPLIAACLGSAWRAAGRRRECAVRDAQGLTTTVYGGDEGNSWNRYPSVPRMMCTARRMSMTSPLGWPRWAGLAAWAPSARSWSGQLQQLQQAAQCLARRPMGKTSRNRGNRPKRNQQEEPVDPNAWRAKEVLIKRYFVRLGNTSFRSLADAIAQARKKAARAAGDDPDDSDDSDYSGSEGSSSEEEQVPAQISCVCIIDCEQNMNHKSAAPRLTIHASVEGGEAERSFGLNCGRYGQS